MDKGRRVFLQSAATAVLGAALTGGAHLGESLFPSLVSVAKADAGLNQLAAPNILLILIDDLNNWAGCLGGHPPGLVRPERISPNIDQFSQGAVLFPNANCSTPACGPSRAGLLWGLGAWSSGIYSNNMPYAGSPVLRCLPSLPEYLRRNGYYTMGVGKRGHWPIPSSGALVWDEEGQMFYPSPVPPVLPANGIPGLGLDWGSMDVPKEAMGDWQTVLWAESRLARTYSQPWFLACGLVKPHQPWYVPEQFLRRFPLEEVARPVVLKGDLRDVPEAGQKLARRDKHAMIVAAGKWKEAVQAYLACISFADTCVGEILAALSRSPYGDNTIVVIWSDNGYHLGEKEHWSKFALWQEATRIFLAIKTPGESVSGRCSSLVTGLDVYPTLVDLAGLPMPSHLGRESPFEWPGRSLARCLDNPQTTWGGPVLCQHGNHIAIVQRTMRLIAYSKELNGPLGGLGFELYDLGVDPHEWNNLALDPRYGPYIQETLAEEAPKHFAPPAPKVK